MDQHSRTQLRVAALTALVCASPFAPHAQAAPDTENYGCEANPRGSLIVLSGDALLGQSVELGIDNPLGTQTPGSATVLFVSALPDASYPCGSPAFGIAMSGPAQLGELLIDIADPHVLAILFGPLWTGPESPAPITIAIPPLPFLVGKNVYAQGAIVDPFGGPVVVGVTEGVRLGIEAACGGALPCIAVQQFDRSADALSYGFDWEYDNGASDSADDATAATTWNDAAAVDQIDWWGYAVAGARGAHTSTVGARSIRCDFDCEARTFGNHFSEDATAQCDLDVTFAAAERLRFAAEATAVVNGGAGTSSYNEAWVSVAGPLGAHFSISAQQGSGDQDASCGWLQIGTHTVDAGATAFAFGQGGFAEVQTTELCFELRFFHAADFDLDGDVDPDDLFDFQQALALGGLDADVDGNGVTDAADGTAFDASWAAAQGP